MAHGFPDDVRVVVLNKNDFNITWRYDDRPYQYLSNKPVTVPPEVAWHHFAYDTRTTQERPKAWRNKEGGCDRHGVSWYEARLVSLGWAEDDWDVPFVKKKADPWFDAKTKRQWFDNFEFKVIGSNSVRSAKEFEALT